MVAGIFAKIGNLNMVAGILAKIANLNMIAGILAKIETIVTCLLIKWYCMEWSNGVQY